MSEFNSITKTAKVYEIDGAGGGNVDVVTDAQAAGKRWVVYYLLLVASAGAGDVTFKSGAGNISGDIPLATTAGQDRIELSNGGAPVLKSSAVGDAFKIFITTAAAMEIDGFAVIGLVD